MRRHPPASMAALWGWLYRRLCFLTEPRKLMPFCKNKSQLSRDLRHNHRWLIRETESLLTIVQWLSTHLPERPMLFVLIAVPLYSRGRGWGTRCDSLSPCLHCSFSYLALSALCRETTFAGQNERRSNWMIWEAFLETEWNESVSPGQPLMVLVDEILGEAFISHRESFPVVRVVLVAS